ncbi:hypothetical protein RDABS01_023986, partial [Bienertia sinuspersici]
MYQGMGNLDMLAAAGENKGSGPNVTTQAQPTSKKRQPGDFNQIESSDQKWGGTDYIPGVQVFRDWKTTWELTDIPFHGVPFTWCNNRDGDNRLYQCLDRATATQDWIQLYPDATMNYSVTGSPMFSYTSKIKRVRYNMFKWCQSYAKKHHTLWEDLNASCTSAQLGVGTPLSNYTEQTTRRQAIQDTTNYVNFSKISPAQAAGLIQPVTNDEVRQAVFQIGSLKAPGVDDTSAEFYQKMWPTVGRDVTATMKHFFANGRPIYWKSQQLLEQPKIHGGLGLINVEVFNEALFAKQAWRLEQQPGLLLARIYSTKYKMSAMAHGLCGGSAGR